MAFWNKNALPPELRDLPAEEIAKRLQEADKLKADLATSNTELETTKTQVSTLQTTVNDLQEKVKNIPPTQKEENEPAPEISTSPTLVDWLADPQKAFSQASAPLTAATLMNGMLVAKMAAAEFIQKQDPVNRRLWKKYEGEVQKLMEAMSPDQRIYPQNWINQFTFVKGMHLDEVVKEAQGQGDAFFSEGVTTSGGGISHTPVNEDRLSPQEEKVCRALKMKPEDWIKRRKALNIKPNA